MSLEIRRITTLKDEVIGTEKFSQPISPSTLHDQDEAFSPVFGNFACS